MKGTKGFTVIELLMTIVIGTILVSIAVPSFLNLTRNNAVATTSNELLGAILLARSEAIRAEKTTTFTTLSNGWQVVNSDGDDLVKHVVDNSNVTIGSADIDYNPRGRADLDSSESIDISYNGSVKSRICLTLTGRPFIRSADDGACP